MAKRKRKSAKKVSVKRRKKTVKKSRSTGSIPVKLKRYPKRPKASASTASLERYYAKIKAIDSDNAKRKTLASNIARFVKK
jgi:hypothetical protein